MATTAQQDLATLILTPTTNLNTAKSIKIAFPECTDLLLSQIFDANGDSAIQAIYKEYFEHSKHFVFSATEKTTIGCINQNKRTADECNCCLPDNCTELKGIRGSVQWYCDSTGTKVDKPISRLFIGDVLYCYWWEMMGSFQVFAKVINDYVRKGEFPIETNIEVGASGLTPLILEGITKLMKMDLASTIRDRVSTYRRCLGWTTDLGRQTQIESIVNSSFHVNFHKFVQSALKYYEELRLAEAIRGTASSNASISTIVDIKSAIELLQKSFTAFNYGRNYNNTLSAIVYILTFLDLIRNVKEKLGIPNTDIKEYISASYDVLIDGKSLSESSPERYILHKNLADNGRAMLMDIEYLSLDDVKTWIENDAVEETIETYRSAYQKLFGIDLFKTIDDLPQKA